MTIKSLVKRKTTNLTGTFVIHADGAFLNGAGIGTGEDKNKSTVKYYWKDKKIPYVSSQAWRRWLRNTLSEETGWPLSRIEAIDVNKDGNTNKVAGQLNPIKYPEDDIFGYMFAAAKSDSKAKNDNKEDKRRLPEVQLIRTSPFKSSLLRGVSDLTRVHEDEGYVHLDDSTPLPYTTQFYSGELSAIFGLDIFRLGVFEKKGKIKEELDPYLYEQHTDKLEKHKHPDTDNKNAFVITRKDLIKHQNELTVNLIKSIAKLRGGAKMAQFGIDVTPSLFIFTGMKSAIMPFDDLMISIDGKPGLNIKALKEIISDYKTEITTPLFIGIRSGYLQNEDDIRNLSEIQGIKVIIDTPVGVADKLSEYLS